MNAQPTFDATNAVTTERPSVRIAKEAMENRRPTTAAVERWPALLRRYRDLVSLRHDYPLILIDRGSCRGIDSLTNVFNGLLQRVAPRGQDGESMRKHALRLEKEIRSLVLGGETGSLSRLWMIASANLYTQRNLSEEETETLQNDLEAVRTALEIKGEVIGCNADTADRVMRHLWRRTHSARVARTRAQLRELAIRLSDLLRSDLLESEESRNSETLKHAFGSGFDDMFDFEAMSRTLHCARPHERMPAERRKRIEWALRILTEDQFFGGEGDHPKFAFASCTEALSEFKERLPRMADLVKAIRIAALEIDNHYRDEIHEEFFRSFDARSLTHEDICWFPSCFVSLHSEDCDANNLAELIEILSSNLPIKVVFKVDRLSRDANGEPEALGTAAWRTQLASMAVNLGSAFVMQATTSNLCSTAERLADGLASLGPALFCLFSPGEGSDMPPYLTAAAAIESRVFPTMVFDPGKGNTLAECFSLAGNPQPDRDWPIHSFSYEDDQMQTVTEGLSFTAVDFLGTDPCAARDWEGRLLTGVALANTVQSPAGECRWLKPVPRQEWNEEMVPLAQVLDASPELNGSREPFVLAVDSNDRLQRVLVSTAAVRHAQQTARRWHHLQELGGIHNSHAIRAVNQAREAWESENRKQESRLSSEMKLQEPETPAAAVVAVESNEKAAPAPAPSRDEAWIETPRCTSCNECVNRNNRMFKYNENKQAFIADLHAGTYRELVEAAESCKVAIIHPGKPWNPDEPGLEDLVARAEPFR